MLKMLTSADTNIVDNVLYSTQFEDYYFSSTDAVAESIYNFIDGNSLSERFQNLDNHACQGEDTCTFVIAETGFGTGLNFFLTLQYWLAQAPTTATLHYISAEKHPLTASQLSEAHKLPFWPRNNKLSQQLIEHYPPLKEGIYDREIVIDNTHNTHGFNHHIHLTLLFGDAAQQLQSYNFIADAWFLDGFTPSRNPDMWTPELFDIIAQRSRHATTFATFTSASAIRKGLLSAGFSVTKTKGFGKKRERLIGTYVPNNPVNT